MGVIALSTAAPGAVMQPPRDQRATARVRSDRQILALLTESKA